VTPDDGFLIKMDEEERYDYLVYRRDRDIVRDKGGALPEKPKTGKEKKPFVDRTLNKALEYMRDQVKKVSAAPTLPEMETASGRAL